MTWTMGCFTCRDGDIKNVRIVMLFDIVVLKKDNRGYAYTILSLETPYSFRHQLNYQSHLPNAATQSISLSPWHSCLIVSSLFVPLNVPSLCSKNVRECSIASIQGTRSLGEQPNRFIVMTASPNETEEEIDARILDALSTTTTKWHTCVTPTVTNIVF